MKHRIGFGYDIHRLVKRRKLFLGGVQISYPKGLLGHSDADVLIHALCDALLGALSLGDIGEYFPDSDPRYHNIPSTELLKKTVALLRRKNWFISNIDIVVIAEEPKLLPYRERIIKSIASTLKIKEGFVSLKGKTNEGLGPIGKKQAIASYAVVLLHRGV
ncbi:MAG: 2-C-methyl-D-erythritol 2,4-cyclodiphosphate synthase [Candidatus Omnitrophica bacterium]|nr:2-C-methyl-D-erythritol 2,4-cyclodiphosphate synthase [Candidatus Omnitrophota bacterium]